ncbi:MAG: hypothetical protein PWP65_1782 [Clostridia bacterium]|nr:hypothetical protein [Clostridia bacterium]
MEGPTKELARFAAELTYGQLPVEVKEKAKMCLLDALGCGLGACRHDHNLKLLEALNAFEASGGSTVWGQKQKSPFWTAVLVNSSMVHTLDFDDFHKRGKVHCGSTVVAPVLAVAERIGSTGEEIITALVAGYEVMLRVAIAADAAAHRLRGWHGTATCGTFGAAAAVGRLLGLDGYWLANALGSAGTQSSGLWAFTADGAMSKKFHAGRAAQSGAMAAFMARSGFTGATKILEAEDGGFLKAVSDRPHLEALTEGLGSKWEIMDVGFKPFACCRTIQPAIEAAITLKRRHGLQWKEIKRLEKIRVYTYSVAKKQNDLPLPPVNSNMAQFNLPFLVAVALRDGTIKLEALDETSLNDEELLGVARKVEVLVDEEIEKQFPAKWGCRMELVAGSGGVLETYIASAKGDPQNPLTLEDQRQKFLTLVDGSPYAGRGEDLFQVCLELEKEHMAARLIRLLSLE